MYGFDTGVISGALLYIGQDFGLLTFFQEVIVSGVLVGALISAAAAGTLTDRFGRRKVLFLTAVLFFLGSIVMGLAPTLTWLILGRLIVGIALGIATVVTPMYLSEIAPAELRGSIITFNQLALTIGILASYFTNYVFTTLIADETVWRWMLGIGAIPALIFGVSIAFLPESPRWLFEQGHGSQAREVLSRIRPQADIESEIEEIEETVQLEQGEDISVLLEPWIRPALIVALGIAVLTQLSGVNAVIYYAPTIFESVGLGSQASLLGTVGIGVVNVLMTVVAIFLIDRVGRRPLLLVGLSGMTLALGGLGATFAFTGLSGAVGWLAVGFLAIDIAFFAVGLGTVIWVIILESFRWMFEVRQRAWHFSLTGVLICL